MAEFDFPIETDPELLLQEWIAEMQSYFPNFDPAPLSLSYRAASAMANMLAVAMDVAAVIPDEIFRTVGSSLHNIQPNDPVSATAETTWTAIDNAGYTTVPTGTLVSVEGILFETTEDVLFPSGTAVVGNISIAALDEGTGGNDLGSAGSAVVLEEAFDHIASVTLVGPTVGGVDGETNDEFIIRLRRTLRVMYPHAVRGSDLELIARTIPAVYRAVSLDNFDYPTSTSNVEGVATVILQGHDGEPVSTPTKGQYRSLIIPDDRRLVNNVLYVQDPAYNVVNVNFSFTIHPGYEPGPTRAQAEAAVADMLSPLNWGLPGSGEEPGWTNKTIVSVYDIAGVLDRVEGLDRVTSITLSVGTGATPTAGDKNLIGVGPLTRPGVITGTAV